MVKITSPVFNPRIRASCRAYNIKTPLVPGDIEKSLQAISVNQLLGLLTEAQHEGLMDTNADPATSVHKDLHPLTAE